MNTFISVKYGGSKLPLQISSDYLFDVYHRTDHDTAAYFLFYKFNVNILFILNN